VSIHCFSAILTESVYYLKDSAYMIDIVISIALKSVKFH